MHIPAVHTPHLHRAQQGHQAPRSRELAGQLRAAITAYRRDHPKLTTDEIAVALDSVRELEIPAAPGTQPAQPAQPAPAHAVRILTMLVLGVAALGATVSLLNSNKHGNPLVWPALALALIVSIATIIAFTLWRDR